MDNDEFIVRVATTEGYANLFREHLSGMDDYFKNPLLDTLIWEATLNCNLKCMHCVNPRDNWDPKRELSTEEAKRILERREVCYF